QTLKCRLTTKFSDRTPALQHAGALALVCALGSAARGRALYGDAARCNAELGGTCTAPILTTRQLRRFAHQSCRVRPVLEFQTLLRKMPLFEDCLRCRAPRSLIAPRRNL